MEAFQRALSLRFARTSRGSQNWSDGITMNTLLYEFIPKDNSSNISVTVFHPLPPTGWVHVCTKLVVRVSLRGLVNLAFRGHLCSFCGHCVCLSDTGLHVMGWIWPRTFIKSQIENWIWRTVQSHGFKGFRSLGFSERHRDYDDNIILNLSSKKRA